jgi:hypothetical protein
MQDKKTKKGVRHDEKFNHELYKRITEIKNIKKWTKNK